MGAWHDQWWRVRDAMTVGRVGVAVAIVLLAGGGYQLWRIDWAVVDNHAELPDVTETIDSSLVTLRAVQLGDFDALEATPSFTWSQFVDVTIKADCAPGRFHISDPTRRPNEQRNDPGLIRSSLGLQIVRRSSHRDGSVVASTVLSGAKVDHRNRMTWSSKIWIPQIAGEYRVRVILQRTSYRDSNQVRHTFEPTLIGALNLHVLPGEPAT